MHNNNRIISAIIIVEVECEHVNAHTLASLIDTIRNQRCHRVMLERETETHMHACVKLLLFPLSVFLALSLFQPHTSIFHSMGLCEKYVNK
jgi:hypothetical protein